MKNVFCLLSGLLFVTITGCNQQKIPHNVSIEKGDSVLINFMFFNSENVLFDNSYQSFKSGSYEKTPLRFVVGNGEVISGFDNLVIGMHVNDSAYVKLEAADAFGKAGVPGIVKPNEPIYLSAKIVGIRKKQIIR